ncbi:LysR family transcriptional regulator, partial [Halobacteriovorax sp. ZH3_bin.1]
MDYRYLRAFTLTAKYLSFSKAAAELKIAQSAVSRQVKLLEESMNE